MHREVHFQMTHLFNRRLVSNQIVSNTDTACMKLLKYILDELRKGKMRKRREKKLPRYT